MEILEHAFLRVERRVLPIRHQQRVADGVLVGGLGDVDRAAERRFAAPVGVDLPAIRNRYVFGGNLLSDGKMTQSHDQQSRNEQNRASHACLLRGS